MDHFTYRNGELHAEDVSLTTIAQAVGTPFYCYASATIEHHYRVLEEAFSFAPTRICYSLKANGNLAVVRTLGRLGAGADVVSGGELQIALAAGISGDKIVFSGVGKTREEIAAALDAGIYQFNAESEPELMAISEIASERGCEAAITLRVNPDVDARTHAKITTGRAEDKFGIPWTRAREVYQAAAAMHGLKVVGVDLHIGSQISELEPYRAAYARIAELIPALRDDGHAIDRLDLGGGLGIPYRENELPPPPPAEFAAMVRDTVGHLGCELLFEPGRMIVGNAGVLVARVIYLKDGESHRFVIVDAAMNDLLRPAMYDAYHRIVTVKETHPDTLLSPAEVVGPICESSDTFARDRALPPLQQGDLLAICSAGAYGAVMSSTYNARAPAAEVLVRGSEFSVVRPRLEAADLIGRDRMPDWLS